MADHAKMVAILQRTANALADDSIDFRGVLYGGFILTADGPKVLEYNTRFGDPETQVLASAPRDRSRRGSARDREGRTRLRSAT